MFFFIVSHHNLFDTLKNEIQNEKNMQFTSRSSLEKMLDKNNNSFLNFEWKLKKEGKFLHHLGSILMRKPSVRFKMMSPCRTKSASVKFESKR